MKKIKILLQNQIDNYKIKLVQEKRNFFFEIQKSIYRYLIDWMSLYVFRKIYKQYLFLKNISKQHFAKSSTNVFEKTWNSFMCSYD